MDLETLLSKLDPDCLLKQNPQEMRETLESSIKVFKHDGRTNVVINKVSYHGEERARWLIEYSLESFDKINPLFKLIIGFLEKEQDERLIKRLMEILVNTSAKTYIHDYLVEVLKSDNLKLKLPIYYHKVLYPIRRIIQSKEFRESIVNFINSDEYPVEFERRKNFAGYHSELFAFPSQYRNCFSIKDFDEDLIAGISNRKMSRLVTQERLESIKLIKDEDTQARLLGLYYYQYLPNLYKTRFVKLVYKEFPHLNKAGKCFWICT